jgi:hypothetical protein
MSNTLTEAQINLIYEADLGRAASSSEQAAWFALDSSGTLNDSQVIAGIVNSAEAVGSAWIVTRLYQSAFNRIPDQAGFAVNTHAIDSFAGGPISELQLAADFVAEQEFMNHYGNLVGQTTTSDPSGMAIFIQALYLNDLGRTGGATEINAWLATGDSAAQVLIGFSDSLEFQNKVDTSVAALLTTNALDAIATPPTTALTGIGPLTPPAVQTFNLTISIDNFTATTAGATFNAVPFTTTFGTVSNTLNTGDNLQDPIGDGTLNEIVAPPILAGNPIYALGVTLNGIKTLNFTNTAFGGIGGFQGSVTGLTTVNDTNSVGGLELGFTGQGIDATGPVLSTVNVSGFAAATGTTGFLIYEEFLAAAAGSASNALSVTLSGALGTTKFADFVVIASDGANGTSTAPNLSYGTQTYTVNSNADLQLQAQANGIASVDGTTTFNFAGTGNLAIGQDFAGDHQKVTTINASTDSGILWITGAAAGAAGNAQATAANPGGLFGSTAGFLNDATGFAVTSFKEGTGVTNLDVSSASPANMAALTTVANAGNTLTNNMIIVNSAVADTVLASTFANIAGFQVLGDTGATGIIAMNMLPASINDIFLETTQVGALTINNPVAALTVDLESNSAGLPVTVGLIGPQSGTTATLDWIVGDAGQGAAGGDAAGALTSFGEEAVTITANGAGAAADGTGLVAFAPNPLGAITLTINGSQSISLGITTPGNGLGAAEALNVAGTALLTPGLFTSLTINDTGATKLVTLEGDGTGFTLLNFQTGGATAPLIGYSTNAQSIHDIGAAGVAMQAGDANFTVGATVATSAGDTIIGSATAGNVLQGSLGNDTITGNTSLAPTAADTIVTAGGADTITLGPGHTASDHVDIYAGFNFVGGPVAPGGDAGSDAIPAGVSTINVAGNKANVGWWGVPTGAAAPITITGASSTSADQSTIANFAPGTKATPQDQVVFSVSAWNATAPDIGLTAVNAAGTALAQVAAGQLGSSVFTVNTGATLLKANTDLIIENTTTFGNASAVASALSTTAANAFATPAQVAGDTYHFLVAYQDLSGNTHIMDFDLFGAAASVTSANGAGTGVGSDMVQLTGIPLSALLAESGAAGNYVHIVA